MIHTWMPEGKRGKRKLARLLGWASFHLLGLAAALAARAAPDVIIVPSPLLTAGAVAWMITAVRGGRFIYNVQELYPDLAVKMGTLRNPAAIQAMRKLEAFVYDRAAAVTTIGEGMRQQVVAKGVPSSKVHVVPNFVDLESLQPRSKTNAFSVEHTLQHSFVVTYAGNLGFAQGLDVVLDAASLLRDTPDVRLLLVGDGVMRDTLAARIEAEQLHNVTLLPHQPFARVPDIYGASDICLVPVIDSVSDDAIPSKVYRIMACERPVLALTLPTSDLAQLVTGARAGVVVHPIDGRGVAGAIRALRDAPAWRLALGKAGREYAVTHVSRPAVTARYEHLVRATTQATRDA